MAIPLKKMWVYEEIIESIVVGTNSTSLVAFHPLAKSKKQVSELIYLEKTIDLPLDEKMELDYYMQLEHLMRLSKVWAYRYIT